MAAKSEQEERKINSYLNCIDNAFDIGSSGMGEQASVIKMYAEGLELSNRILENKDHFDNCLFFVKILNYGFIGKRFYW